MQMAKGGAAISIKEFDVWAGSSPLILDVSWQIMPNERWALLGGNGCGKSTLLRAIGQAANGERFEDGELEVAQSLRVGMLEQTAITGSTASVRDEVMSRMGSYQAAKAALAEAEAQCTTGSERELESLEKANATPVIASPSMTQRVTRGAPFVAYVSSKESVDAQCRRSDQRRFLLLLLFLLLLAAIQHVRRSWAITSVGAANA